MNQPVKFLEKNLSLFVSRLSGEGGRGLEGIDSPKTLFAQFFLKRSRGNPALNISRTIRFLGGKHLAHGNGLKQLPRCYDRCDPFSRSPAIVYTSRVYFKLSSPLISKIESSARAFPATYNESTLSARARARGIVRTIYVMDGISEILSMK